MMFVDKVHRHANFTRTTPYVVQKILRAGVHENRFMSPKNLRNLRDTLIREVMNSALCAQFECTWGESRRMGPGLCHVEARYINERIGKYVKIGDYGKFELEVMLRQGGGHVK